MENCLFLVSRLSMEENQKQYELSSTMDMDVEQTCDRIGCLPDSILLHILSFMKMREVSRTPVLSKRWRYLCASVPCLNFVKDSTEPKTDMVTLIDRSLFNYEASKVRALLIRFDYDATHDFQVISWIQFAIRHNVEELVLCFIDDAKPDWLAARFGLPNSLFSCKSLTTLGLHNCDLNMPSSFCLPSLKSLSLGLLDLSPDTIEKLTSSCPSLKVLSVNSCNCYSDLNICITNQNVKTLKIYDDFANIENPSDLVIQARYLHSLEFYNDLPRKSYSVKISSSLQNVRFGTSVCSRLFYGEVECDIPMFLVDLGSAQQLSVANWFIQILSIREVLAFDPLPIKVKCLVLETDFTKWELPGIMYLLKSSPALVDLVITRLGDSVFDDDFMEEFHFDKEEWWKSVQLEYSSMLHELKIITIYFDLEELESGDSEAEEKLNTKIEFVRFLLKNSKVLEKMTIRITKHNQSSDSYEPQFKLTQKVRAFPRASPNAEIYII